MELPFDRLPQRLFPATPSRLNTWLDCPRRYRMTYLDRPAPAKGPAWAHNSFGATVHNALRSWVSGPRRLRSPEAAATAVDVAWVGDGYRDEAQSQRARESARAMVRSYVATLDPDAEPAGVERTVASRAGTLAVQGRIDRLDQRGDELVVVDYKTGRRPLDAGDARGSLALALYAVAAERTLRRPCRTVELHHVPTGEVHGFTHTEASLSRHLERAEDIADEVRAATAAASAESFPVRTGPGCAWCDFLRVCPEGRAVAAPREPWAALPADWPRESQHRPRRPAWQADPVAGAGV